MVENPLLDTNALPRFSEIRPEHVEPAIDWVLADNRAKLQALTSRNGPYTWDNLVDPVEAMEERLNRIWSPVRHLNSVRNSEALREAYKTCLPKLSDYASEVGQNEVLYRAFLEVAKGPQYEKLDSGQRKVIDNALRDFRLAGVHLGAGEKARYKQIQQELSTLSNRFEDNVLDATQACTKRVTDDSELAGLPESARNMARQAASQKGFDGWLLTLEFPSYIAVMTYADRRGLRQEVYEAHSTRASDQGPHAGQWDNGQIMERILALRHELARVTGFPTYAERSLATKMVQSAEQVMEFLHDLATRSVSAARRELEELRSFAAQRFGVQDLQAWDIAYYAEKLRQERYSISQEMLKPYFPEARVLEGLFGLIGRIFGLSVRERTDVDTWHPDVRFFEIVGPSSELRGQFYMDLYARSGKRGGAWMDDCVTRMRTPEGLQIPVAFIVCNLSPPVGDKPAMFTHQELLTLFHEFGHGLHHMLTRIDYPGVSGIHGVPWDAVELPSQFMENWCWEREALDLVAAHFETGEPLPEGLFRRMRAARNFQSAMFMVRQLEFALFDFRLHLEYDPAQGGRIQQILDQVRDAVAAVKPPPFNRFQHGFTHIFSGGYAAGYYSYKWAEVLSADAFAMFEERGLFDLDTGRRFLQTILEQGGARDPMELFVEFRGRPPSIEALLRHTDIISDFAVQ